MLGPEFDFLKMLDFRVVRAADSPDDVNLTGTQIVGSPAFMSPELVLGEKQIDGRADLYGLGCVAYWLLAAQPVFQADTTTAMCVQHATAQPQPVSVLTESPIPPELGDVPVPEAWTQERAEDWWRINEPDDVG